VHSILHKKQKSAASINEEDEDDDDCAADEIVASSEAMLHSLVERMVKCEPEDFELVRLLVACLFHYCQITHVCYLVHRMV